MKKPNLSEAARQSAVRMLLTMAKSENITKLPKLAYAKVAKEIGCSDRTIRRLWGQARRSGLSRTNMKFTVSGKKKGRSGRKCKWTPEQVTAKLLSIPTRYRTNFRRMENKLGIPKSTLQRMFKKGLMVRHSNAIKPTLTAVNKYSRVVHALKWITKAQQTLVFNDMMNIIHLDEKWFYLTTPKKSIYLAPGETPPHRTTKSKRYIAKVMFLAAIARPRVLLSGEIWDGKIGMWPIIEWTPAKRKSRNRPAGTLVPSNLNVNQNVYRKMLLDDVIPAILAKWPHEEFGTKIMLQQDNARSHVPVNDACTKEAFDLLRSDGWDLTLYAQPPNSPDTNILDLGFFASIQSLQHRRDAKNSAELISFVLEEFELYPASKIACTFLTLQSCLLEMLKCDGGNSYKIPHLRKSAQIRLGRLPENLVCPVDLYTHGQALLNDSDATTMASMLAKEVEKQRSLDELAVLMENAVLNDRPIRDNNGSDEDNDEDNEEREEDEEQDSGADPNDWSSSEDDEIAVVMLALGIGGNGSHVYADV